MASEPIAARDLSARRIIGFACNQAFVFYLLYMGAPHAASFGDAEMPRIDLLAILLFMVVGFALVRLLIRALGPHRLPILFSRPLLYIYAVVAGAGSLTPAILQPSPATFAMQGALVGVACALLLTAWGRAFGRESSRVAVPEVFML